MTAASKRRTVVFGCVAIAVLVLANAAWQWKAASVYGWTGLKVRVESSFPGEVNAPQTKMLVEHVVPGSPASFSGFRPGDRIVSLDGSTDQLGSRFRALRPRQVARIGVDQPGGRTLTLRPIAPFGRPGVPLLLAFNLLTGLVSLAIGLFVYRKKPEDTRALLLFGLTCLYAIVRFAAVGPVHRYGLEPGSNLIRIATYVGAGLLFFPVLLHFFLVFPQPRPEMAMVRLRAIYTPSLIAAGSITLFLLTFTVLLPAESRRWPDAVALLRRVSPEVARWEVVGLALASFLLTITLIRAGRSTREQWRCSGARGVVLYAPGTVILAVCSGTLLASVLVRLLGMSWQLPARLDLILLGIAVATAVVGCSVAIIVVYPVAACINFWRSYREASNPEKRQLWWPLLGLLLGVAGFLLTGIVLRLLSKLCDFRDNGAAAVIVFYLREVLPNLALLLIPLSIAFAVLKYRLLDIDVYIRKTIIYGGLSALLGAVFILIVGGVGTLLTGAFARPGDWLPVAATLTAGMLFIPIRDRVQQVVDRRFYRRRDYPAALSHLAAADDLQKAVDIIQEAIPARSAALWFASSEAPVFELSAVTGGVDTVETRRLPAADICPRLRMDGDHVVPCSHDGKLLGYLAVGPKLADTAWDEEDRNFLDAAAGQIALSVLADPKDSAHASQIQRALLPVRLPQPPGMSVSGVWQPARFIGGDYYDVLSLSDSLFGFAIADVSGKGTPAALLMSNLQAGLKLLAPDTPSPARLCARLNALICSNVTPGKFITLFYGLLDSRNRRLWYCNAGHNPPILMEPGSAERRLSEGGLPLGIFPNAEYADGDADLKPGSKLVLYTDGVCDASDQDGKEFGEEGLIHTIQHAHTADASALRGAIENAVRRHCGGVFSDDVTLLVVAVEMIAAARR